MAGDIDVNIEELEEFICILQKFQDDVTEKFKAVQYNWDRCDESWEGESKERFTKDFDDTGQRVRRTLEAGDDALEWLRKYLKIIQDFEDGYR